MNLEQRLQLDDKGKMHLLFLQTLQGKVGVIGEYRSLKKVLAQLNINQKRIQFHFGQGQVIPNEYGIIFMGEGGLINHPKPFNDTSLPENSIFKKIDTYLIRGGNLFTTESIADLLLTYLVGRGYSITPSYYKLNDTSSLEKEHADYGVINVGSGKIYFKLKDSKIKDINLVYLVLSSQLRSLQDGLFLQVSFDTYYQLRLNATDVFRIGRDENKNQIIFRNEQVSREHAVIYKQGDKYFIKDLGSKNGTRVNDTMLYSGEFCEVKTGDRIGLGMFPINICNFIFPPYIIKDPLGKVDQVM